MKTVSMEEIQKHSTGQFFNPKTLKFFSTRLPQTGYQVGKSFLFVSSEKMKERKRSYNIRMMDAKGKTFTIDRDYATQAIADSRVTKWLEMRLPLRLIRAFGSVNLSVQRKLTDSALNELTNRKIPAELSEDGEIVIQCGKRQLKWSQL